MSMTATKMVAPSAKLKIKLSTNRIEVDPGTKCESRKRVSRDDENWFCNSKEKSFSSVPRPFKRGPPGSIEGQKVKRQKMDRKASSQCATILKCLTSHKYSWVFNKPVDPVALSIPDYFTVISQPMDLGTIKTKLEKNIYLGIEEFAADVRLTFSNAMTYNPPGHDVHLMAKALRRIFEGKWKDVEKNWNGDNEHGNFMTETVRETVREIGYGTHTLQQDTLPKKSQVPQLKGIQKNSSLAGRDDNKVEVPKSSRIPGKFIGKGLHKGKDNRNGSHPSVSVKAHPSSGLVTSTCRICGEISCRCYSGPTLSSSDLTSEGSGGRYPHACGADALRLDDQTHCRSPPWKKSDLESDGHACSSSQLAIPSTDDPSGEVGSAPVFDIPLSPKKALRAAMLKRRFADTILKAQQKTLLDHGDKSDPLRIHLEKERSERLQREERGRIQAQMKAAARAKAEEGLKQQREKAREAARAAIEKMERTVEIENSLEIVKELQWLSGTKLCYPPRRCGSILDKSQVEHPLERLGLFIKDENMNADEILSGVEEGEIF